MSIQSQKIRKARLRRWKRRLTLVGLFVLCVLGGAYLYVANPQRLGMLVSGELGRLTGSEVSISGAYFDFDGKIRLEKLRMRLKAKEGVVNPLARRLVDVDRVDIQHRIWDLLWGNLKCDSLAFHGLNFYSTEVVGAKASEKEGFNLGFLTAGDWVGNIPDIEIVDGKIHVDKLIDGKIVKGGVKRVKGWLRESETEGYRFEFDAIDDVAVDGGLRLVGDVDPRAKSVKAELKGLKIDKVDRAFLPHALQERFDLHHPDVHISGIGMNFDFQRGVWHVRVGFEDKPSEILLPLTGGEVKEEDLIAVRGVLGFLDFTRTRLGQGRFEDQVSLDVKGELGLEGAMRLGITGEFRGLEEGDPFALSVNIEKADIPSLNDKLPAVVLRALKQFDPQGGTFEGDLVFKREEANGEVLLGGTIHVADANLSYYQFPGRAKGVSGDIKLLGDKIGIDFGGTIVEGGGDILVEGMITKLGERGGVTMRVEGKRIKLETGRASLSDEKFKMIQGIIDQYTDRKQYDRLIGKGLIVSGAMREGYTQDIFRLEQKIKNLRDEGLVSAAEFLEKQVGLLRLKLDKPVFDLGGRLSFVTNITPTEDPDNLYESETVVTFGEMGLLYEFWGYPLEVKGGRLVFENNRALIEKVEVAGVDLGAGQSRGSGFVDGKVLWGRLTEDGKAEPSVKILAQDFGFNKLMVASMPEQGVDGGGVNQYWKEDLHLAGKLGAVCDVNLNDQREVVYRVDIHLEEGRANPYEKGYVLDNLDGHVIISKGLVELKNITAVHKNIVAKNKFVFKEHDDTAILLNGKLVGESSVFELNVTDLDLAENNTLTTLPEQMGGKRDLEKLFKTYEPSGVMDLSVKLTKADAGKDAVAVVLFKPKEIGVKYQGVRVDFDRVSGEVQIAGGELKLNDVKGHWGDESVGGVLGLAGSVDLVGKGGFNIGINSKAKKLDSAGKAMMPESLQKVVDGLAFNGPFEVRDGLLVSRDNGKGGSIIDFKGEVVFDGARVNVGIGLEKLQGKLLIDQLRVEGDDLRVGMRFLGDQAVVSKRLVKDLGVSFVTNDAGDQLLIKGITGDLGEGKITGEGYLGLGEESDFYIEMKMGKTPVASLVKTVDKEVKGGGVITGMVSGHFKMKGTAGAVTRRSGRGEFSVTETNLFETDAAFKGLPAFNSLKTKFAINNDQIIFNMFNIKSDLMVLENEGGHINFENNKIEIDLNVKTGKIPVGFFDEVSDVGQMLLNQVAMVQVRGSIEKPEVNVVTLDGLKRIFVRVFPFLARDIKKDKKRKKV